MTPITSYSRSRLHLLSEDEFEGYGEDMEIDVGAEDEVSIGRPRSTAGLRNALK